MRPQRLIITACLLLSFVCCLLAVARPAASSGGLMTPGTALYGLGTLGYSIAAGAGATEHSPALPVRASAFASAPGAASSAPPAPLVPPTGGTNLALGKPATQSTTGWDSPASLAVDGNTDGNWFNGSVTHTNGDPQGWWQVDLGASHRVGKVDVFLMTVCCSSHQNFDVKVSTDGTTWHSFYVPGPVDYVSVPVNLQARYVRVQLRDTDYLALAEVQVWEQPQGNLAQGKPTAQSSTLSNFNPPGDSWRAVDGNTDGGYFSGSVTHTNGEAQGWWQVDLGSVGALDRVDVWNRTDCCAERLTDFYVLVSDAPFNSTDLNTSLSQAGVSAYRTAGQGGRPTPIQVGRTGRYVRVQLVGSGVLSLAEVQVWGETGANGPAGHWKFDEGTGVTAADSSGGGNPGLLQNGAGWGGGQSGTSVILDGVDDYVQMGSSPSLAVSGALTVAAWVYPTGPGSLPTAGGIIVNKEGEYELARFQDGTIRWAIANQSPGWQWVNTGLVAPLNQWTHVTLTYDGVSVKTYANGQLAHTASAAGAIGDFDSGRNDLRIGGRQGESQFFQGRLDGVSVYNRSLSQTEVSSAVPQMVTVTATDPSASEAGPDAGTFTVRRTGATGAALTVNFTVGGTAAGGTDYDSLGTSVTIPAGASSQVVTVTPFDDVGVESGGETVALTLAADDDYMVGTPSGAVVTIADNDAAAPKKSLSTLRDEASYLPQAAPAAQSGSPAPPCEDCYEAPGSDPQFSQSRGRLANETGEPAVDLGSKNFNWSLPLVNLPGRAGLGLSLTLSYNSLVWVKQGNAFQFDADGGYPSPGFQLGFPQLQKRFVDGSGQSAYMVVLPSGGRITFRFVSTDTYEDRDGSYTQLKLLANGWARMTTTDGTQYTFEPKPNGEKRCVEIKDRNGNHISIGYDGAGRVSTAKDTLGRIVNFLYHGNGRLYQLTQNRAGSGHTDLLAQFSYSDLYMSPYFTDSAGNQLTTLGPNGAAVTALTQVWLTDGTTYNFDYTLYGQVYKITKRAPDGHDLSYEWYNLSSSPDTPHIAQQDCPRFTERRDWARHGVMHASQEISTFYFTNAAGTVTEVRYPDGKTVYKEFFSDGSGGLRAGLLTGTELWYESDRKKWTTTVWENDPAGGGPRVKDSIVEDKEGNRRRTNVEYGQGFNLPTHVREYGKVNGQEVMLRRMSHSYNLDPAYVGRRIIGLPAEQLVYDVTTGFVVAKELYMYDWGAPYFDAQTPSVQHDTTNYSSGFIVGRGNLVAVQRFSCQGNNLTCDSVGAVWASLTGYDTAGSRVWVKDALGHQTSFSYADSFSDTSKNGLNTRAYPTSFTDAEGYISTAQYNYSTGATTETRRASSGGAGQPVTYETHSLLYDWGARLVKDTTVNTGFYTRWDYPADGLSVKTFRNVRPDIGENYSAAILDGWGRVRRTATYMPGSTTRYSGRQFFYDVMGRLVRWTNPTETTGDLEWTASGDDAAAGWVSTSRTYDWMGRPRVTTHADTTTTELSYGGCGCAGGEVVTARDQRGRKKKLYHDVLGRMGKVEELNYDSSVYSTAVYVYNARDQLEKIRHYQGSGGTPQERTFGYDGHGRLISRATPEQGTMTFGYNDDDTTQWVRDARGVKTVYEFTPRHSVRSKSYDLSGVLPGQNVAQTPKVAFEYDAAGNRTKMTERDSADNRVVGSTTYHYDSLSRMDWEERTFDGLAGAYRLTYDYNHAGLAWVSVPTPLGNSRVDYAVDHTGTPLSVTGSGPWSAPTYVANMGFRAFGGLKSAAYGNGRALYAKYDKMLRIDEWGVSGVTGWKYSYSDFGENTGRVTYAQNTFNVEPGRPAGADPTLDRSYDYDQVGRLFNSYTGTEARAHTGRPGGAWEVHDGPYSQAYLKDVWGNVTQKMGRAGDPDQFVATYTNNRRDGFSYDASGNLTFDRGQRFTYDATGQQKYVDWTNLTQFYDGDRLRVKKTEGSAATPTYYLRSSVLGGQVVAEFGAGGAWQRGYVYDAAGALLAIQSGGAVKWAHQDPATKSQRLADASGAAVAGVDLDPWGRETNRSWNSAQQPRRYTTYTRDSNESDEAMHRRYNRWHLRFDQPDPSDGSYDLANPRTFNRYTYANNDPVNLTDPTGLAAKICQMYDGDIVCTSGDLFPSPPGADQRFGGWGGGFDINSRPSAGREIIELRENASYPFYIVHAWNDIQERHVDLPFVSMFAGWTGWAGFPLVENKIDRSRRLQGEIIDCVRGKINDAVARQEQLRKDNPWTVMPEESAYYEALGGAIVGFAIGKTAGILPGIAGGLAWDVAGQNMATARRRMSGNREIKQRLYAEAAGCYTDRGLRPNPMVMNTLRFGDWRAAVP